MKSHEDHYLEDPYQREVRYFVPGQVYLHMEHPTGLSGGSLIEFLQNHPVLRERWNNVLTRPEPQSILTFPLVNERGRRISVVPAQLQEREDENEDRNYTRTAEVIFEIYDELRPRLKENADSDSVTLNSVVPNWLMSGANHQIGLGGPGGFPSRAKPKENFWPPFILRNFPVPAEKLGKGRGVHIAILDTAPWREALFQAYLRWQSEHPLIQSLLAPGGPLHVYPASSDDFRELEDFSIAKHRYLMPDHGLFVAGIIHTLAPEATLHLYEVLNPYGVGSFDSIAKGLIKAINNPAILNAAGQMSPLMINCSLVLNEPSLEDLKHVFKSERIPPEQLNEDFLAFLRQPFEHLASLFTNQPQVLLVAAAGNEAVQPNNRPAARYPAAFDNVIGVGALPRGAAPRRVVQKSVYSNQSDDPARIGYATLGGEEGAGKGILGVYISDFPRYKGAKPVPGNSIPLDSVEYRPNPHGWAWWAGTSFATPVLSGALAAWWSADLTRPAQDVSTVLNSIADRADNREKAVLVRQVIRPTGP